MLKKERKTTNSDKITLYTDLCSPAWLNKKYEKQIDLKSEAALTVASYGKYKHLLFTEGRGEGEEGMLKKLVNEISRTGLMHHQAKKLQTIALFQGGGGVC